MTTTQQVLIEKYISRIRFINVGSALKPHFVETLPVGSLSSDMYSIEEYQSLAIGIEQLAQQISRESYAMKLYSKQEILDYTGNASKSFQGDDFIIQLGKGIGWVAKNLGKGVEDIEDGAGSLIKTTGSTFAGILDSLSSWLYPVIACVVIALVLFVIYQKWQRGDFQKNDIDEK